MFASCASSGVSSRPHLTGARRRGSCACRAQLTGRPAITSACPRVRPSTGIWASSPSTGCRPVPRRRRPARPAARRALEQREELVRVRALVGEHLDHPVLSRKLAQRRLARREPDDRGPGRAATSASTSSAVDRPDSGGPATANPGNRPRSGPTQPARPRRRQRQAAAPRAQPSRAVARACASVMRDGSGVYPQRRGRDRARAARRPISSFMAAPCAGPLGSEPAKASCTSRAAGSSTPRPSAGSRA